VIQQLRSFGELHAGELEALAAELDNTIPPAQLDDASPLEVAARLRIYRDVQRDEAQMIVDELVDVQSDMAATGQAEEPPPPTASGSRDPAVNSPRRARWLAQQAAEEERRRQPLTRRDFFSRGTKPDE
jgi:hypothetical protein